MTAKKAGRRPLDDVKYNEAFRMETVPEDLVSEALHHTLTLCQRGNCYDSAHAESFWSRFRAELLDDGPLS